MNQETVTVLVSKLKPNPNNPRSEIKDVSDLVASIKERGWISPLTVKRIDNGFQVIAGNRRLEACRQLEIKSVNCIVVDCDDAKAFEIATSENIVRQGMTPEDECAAVAQMVNDGKTPREISAFFGYNPRWALGRLRIYNLGEKALELLKNGFITLAHAEILTMAPEDRLDHFLDYAKWHKPEELQRAIINEKKNLEHACFDSKKICKNCKKRTAEQPDIFGGIDDSHCLDSDCFNANVDKFIEAKRNQFLRDGYEEVPEDELYKVNAYWCNDYIDVGTEVIEKKEKIAKLKELGIKPRFFINANGEYGLTYRLADGPEEESEDDDDDEDTPRGIAVTLEDGFQIHEYEVRNKMCDISREETLRKIEDVIKSIPDEAVCLILDSIADNDYDSEFTFCQEDDIPESEAENEDYVKNLAHIEEERPDGKTHRQKLAEFIENGLEPGNSKVESEFLELSPFESFRDEAIRRLTNIHEANKIAEHTKLTN